MIQITLYLLHEVPNKENENNENYSRKNEIFKVMQYCYNYGVCPPIYHANLNEKVFYNLNSSIYNNISLNIL